MVCKSGIVLLVSNEGDRAVIIGYLINADGTTAENLRGLEMVHQAIANIKPGQTVEVKNGMGDDTDIIARGEEEPNPVVRIWDRMVAAHESMEDGER